VALRSCVGQNLGGRLAQVPRMNGQESGDGSEGNSRPTNSKVVPVSEVKTEDNGKETSTSAFDRASGRALTEVLARSKAGSSGRSSGNWKFRIGWSGAAQAMSQEDVRTLQGEHTPSRSRKSIAGSEGRLSSRRNSTEKLQQSIDSFAQFERILSSTQINNDGTYLEKVVSTESRIKDPLEDLDENKKAVVKFYDGWFMGVVSGPLISLSSALRPCPLSLPRHLCHLHPLDCLPILSTSEPSGGYLCNRYVPLQLLHVVYGIERGTRRGFMNRVL